jgi:IclR family mhp operon transcriptional activator
MNTRQRWGLHELQQAVGLPKTTLFRILRSLQTEGYVRAEGDCGCYRLTARVNELGGGYTDKSQVVDLGAPIALQVTRQIKWPLAIGTLDGDALVVRYSTMPYSPVAVHATTLGHRLGLLESAMGHAYLAHCDEVEKNILLDLLLPPSTERGILERELRQVALQGYAVRMPNWQRGSATVAVPIRQGATVLASLSLTTFGRSMTPALIGQHVPVLQQAAVQMAQACCS